MDTKLEKLFYTLSIFLLFIAFFVLQPSHVREVSAMQSQIQQQFSVGWQQTLGDQPYFDDLAQIYYGINNFYEQAADASIALLGHGAGDEDLARVFKTTYHDLAAVFAGKPDQKPPVAVADITLPSSNFMSQPAIENIVLGQKDSSLRAQRSNLLTENEIASSQAPRKDISGTISGAAVEPVNLETPWVTLQDNFTGQKYCLAIYNGDVNKYLGACKNDYH